MAQNFKETEKKVKILDIMLFQSITEDCIQFLSSFDLPKTQDTLIKLMVVIYNSFSLPDYKSKTRIEFLLEKNKNEKILIFSKDKINSIPGSVEDNLVKNMLRSKSEYLNGNLFHFLEDLLIDDNPQLKILDILDIYEVVSDEYYKTRCLILLDDKLMLSEEGKAKIKKNVWLELHSKYWDLVFDYLSEKAIYSSYFNNYFAILEKHKLIFDLLPKED